MKIKPDLSCVPVLFPISAAGQSQCRELMGMNCSFHADKLISKRWSLISTKLVGLPVWLPPPKTACNCIVPRALRCVVFGEIPLKLMGEEKEVGGKNRKKKAWHCFFSHFTSCSWCRAHLARFRDSRWALDKNDLNVSSSLQTCLVAFCLHTTGSLAWPLWLPPECYWKPMPQDLELLKQSQPQSAARTSQHSMAWHSMA